MMEYTFNIHWANSLLRKTKMLHKLPRHKKETIRTYGVCITIGIQVLILVIQTLILLHQFGVVR